MDWDQWVIAAIIAKIGLYSASFFAIGTALFWMFCNRVSELGFRFGKWIFIAAVIAIALSLVRLGVRAGVLIDEGWSGMLDLAMLQLALEGKVGQSTILRIVGLLLLLFGLIFPPQRLGLLVLGSIAVSASFALVGHATGEPRWALTFLIALHLVIVSFWFGALAPLASNASIGPIQTAKIAHRFGNMAAIAVPVLIIAGVAFTVIRFGNPLGLLGSTYGWVLLIKLLLVSTLLGLAALNKLRLAPQLASGNKDAASQLQRSISIEAILFMTIFIATAVLTTAAQLPE